ncbi:hypothetical protein J6590_014138 [Homalodisca vitripennis]|nr:hypothetical protein J6590_014138 [Homalodisca vitripennis]
MIASAAPLPPTHRTIDPTYPPPSVGPLGPAHCHWESRTPLLNECSNIRLSDDRYVTLDMEDTCERPRRKRRKKRAPIIYQQQKTKVIGH